MTRIITIARITWLEMIRRKDVYVLLILLGAMLVTLVSLDIFNMGGTTGYVKEVGLLFAWFFSWVLAINTAARVLPQEESRGTIFPLLAKPLSRAELIAGKWLGCWSIVTAATVAFYALVFAVVAVKSGSFVLPSVAQAIILHSAAIAVFTAIALFFSCRMNNDAAVSLSYILSAASILVVPQIPELLTRETGITGGLLMMMYNLLPHFEVFDMRERLVHNYGPAGWTPVALAFTYGVAVTGIFLFLAWFSYRNKKFSRDKVRE